MGIGWFNIPFNLLNFGKGNAMVTPQHPSADIAKSWPGCGMLCKLLHFADAQKSVQLIHVGTIGLEYLLGVWSSRCVC